MRPWLLLSVLVFAGCVHRPEKTDSVDQTVKARYWAIQEAQRVGPATPMVRLPLHQPERFEDGARRVPSTVEITVTRSP